MLLPVMLTFAAVALLSIGVVRVLGADRQDTLQRLFNYWERAGNAYPLREELNKPFSERIIMPLLRMVSGWTSDRMPAKRREHWQRMLQRAGTPWGLGPAEFLAAKWMLAAGMVLVFGTALGLGGDLGSDSLKVFGVAVVIALLGWYTPDLFLHGKITARQECIRRSLPNALDLLTTCVEAGLGFDAAMAKVAEKTKGAFAEECQKVLQAVMMGKPRREALREMATRVGVNELSMFITAVVQADQLGLGIANVLRQQSGAMRLKRRQIIEEKAMKAPVKMLLPLIFFIFPAIFIVLLGPAVIQIFEALSR